MKKEICQKCENYIQHYSYSKFGITKMDCGHCYKRQMNKKECKIFKESSKNFEQEISIFDEIAKYKFTFNTIFFKLETLNSMLDKIENEIKLISKK